MAENCLPFFLRSGFPFFTVAMTISPQAADGSLFRRAPQPTTEMTYRFLAPVLSAQFMMAPTGRASDILNLFPAAPPRPRLDAMLPLSANSQPLRELETPCLFGLPYCYTFSCILLIPAQKLQAISENDHTIHCSNFIEAIIYLHFATKRDICRKHEINCTCYLDWIFSRLTPDTRTVCEAYQEITDPVVEADTPTAARQAQLRKPLSSLQASKFCRVLRKQMQGNEQGWTFTT